MNIGMSGSPMPKIPKALPSTMLMVLLKMILEFAEPSTFLIFFLVRFLSTA